MSPAGTMHAASEACSVRLPASLIEEVRQLCQQTRVKRSDVFALALEAFLRPYREDSTEIMPAHRATGAQDS